MSPHLDWRESKKRKAAARAKRIAAREAKQVVSSHTDSATASAETRPQTQNVTPKIVQGGLPSHGRRK